jgi:hypothetical protein
MGLAAERGILTSPEAASAMSKVDRKLFVPPTALPYNDSPQVIGRWPPWLLLFPLHNVIIHPYIHKCTCNSCTSFLEYKPMMVESWHGWITCSNALHLGLKGSKETRKMGSTLMRFSTRFAVPMLLVVQHFLTDWLTDRDAYAYGDHGLGIAGFGATISAPHMVRLEITDLLMDYPWCTSILIWINAVFLLCLFLGPDWLLCWIRKLLGWGLLL